MARTDLVVRSMPRAGIALGVGLVAANADGHAFDHSPRRLLVIKNSNGTAAAATVQIPATVEGQDVVDLPVTIPANDSLLLPPFSAVYRQANGKVYIDYAAPAGLTVGVLEQPA
ncbi:hypothetical protein ABZ470_26345 [Streptosporangium sp. NPDC020072]|uniref:hypothetical protein n=1 Tax=Streptosporangium sp. NPDC020072 TaxID=3154788 RepID=UPI00344804B9